MRNAEDMEELDAWPEYEDTRGQRCPECGDDDRHERDCSRNYRNRTYGITVKPDPRRENYWLGYRHGQRLSPEDHERALWEELRYAVGTNQEKTDRYRAFSLGVLRGYRSARP